MVSLLATALSAPLSARLYGSREFGIYATFTGVVTVICSVISLSLNAAPMIAATSLKSLHAVVLSLKVNWSTSIALFVAYLVFMSTSGGSTVGSDVAGVLAFAPLTIALTTSVNSVYAWANRASLYRRLAINKTILAVVTSVMQVSIGLVLPTARGLVMSNVIGLLLAVLSLSGPFVTECKREGVTFRSVRLLDGIREQWRLIVWSTPANLINSSISALPDIAIASRFGASEAGRYSVASRLVGMPLALVSSSLQDIFRQVAADEFAETGSCRVSFRQYLRLLTLTGLVVTVPTMLLAPVGVELLLGRDWDNAGVLVQATSLLVITRFVSSPLSFIWIIRSKQMLNLLWQIGLLAITFASLVLVPGWRSDLSPTWTLFIYGVTTSLWYVLCIFVSMVLSRAAE